MPFTPTNKLSGHAEESPKPLYQQVKVYVLHNIENGSWPLHSQIPSEHMMVRQMGISRMTIHRALRELTQAGILDRIQGVGTFVSKPKNKKIMMELKDIDRAIVDQGRQHDCQVHFLQIEALSSDDARRMQMREGDDVFRAYFVHRENGFPIMVEDRFVRPDAFPGYLEQDFTRTTSDQYLRANSPLLTHDQKLLAVMSTPEVQHFLELEQSIPCFQINQNTRSGTKIISSARLIYAGHRFQIG